ncbi:MAG: leucine-rich repeat domain-containing protein, partial [Malacoplasma sp.]|nr:leucine-rich repeat domain-containing protein [Malacoplasma sp.]
MVTTGQVYAGMINYIATGEKTHYLENYRLHLPLIDGTIKEFCTCYITSLKLCSCKASVKHIGDMFLCGCSHLETLDLSGLKNIETIGDKFLSDCMNLDCELELPPYLKSFGEDFMRSCDKFNHRIEIPFGVTSISDCFMRGCSAFNNELILPYQLKTIKNYFLAYCTSYCQSIVLPKTVTAIGNDFMSDCHSFSNFMFFPESLISIGDYFLCNCWQLQAPVTLPDSLLYIGDFFMNYCVQYNLQVTLPKNLKSIGICFMKACYKYNKPLIIPASVTSIGSSFMHCYSDFDFEKNLHNLSNARLDIGWSKATQEYAEFLLQLAVQAIIIGLVFIWERFVYKTEEYSRIKATHEKNMKNPKVDADGYKTIDHDSTYDDDESQYEIKYAIKKVNRVVGRGENIERVVETVSEKVAFTLSDEEYKDFKLPGNSNATDYICICNSDDVVLAWRDNRGKWVHWYDDDYYNFNPEEVFRNMPILTGGETRFFTSVDSIGNTRYEIFFEQENNRRNYFVREITINKRGDTAVIFNKALTEEGRNDAQARLRSMQVCTVDLNGELVLNPEYVKAAKEYNATFGKVFDDWKAPIPDLFPSTSNAPEPSPILQYPRSTDEADPRYIKERIIWMDDRLPPDIDDDGYIPINGNKPFVDDDDGYQPINGNKPFVDDD